MSRFLLKQKNFFGEAKELRATFDKKFADPKQASSDRFVWDYWHVPGQYSLLRTPADYYFPKTLYGKLEKKLLLWGRENLGCDAISPPWLSCYIDGSEQEIHSDVPHGPWAFVFSLTKWRQRNFSGGETFILRPELLDYWKNFTDAEGREQDSFLSLVAPEFNQLLVFDPRFPHGVRQLRGSRDPREGRLVVHGWFTEPKPYVKGPISVTRLAPDLDGHVGELVEKMAQSGGAWHGTMSLRLQTAANGEVRACKILVNTLVSLHDDPYDSSAVTRLVQKHFTGCKVPRASGPSEITLPLLFR